MRKSLFSSPPLNSPEPPVLQEPFTLASTVRQQGLSPRVPLCRPRQPWGPTPANPHEVLLLCAFSLPALFYSFCLPPEGSTLHLHVAAHSAVLEPAASPVSWYRRSLLPKFSSYPCSIVPLLTHLSFGHEALKFGGRLCLWHKCCVTLFPQSCIFLRDHYICFNHMDFKSVHVFGFLIIFPTFTRVRCAICVWFLVFASLLTLSLGPKGGNDRWR